jgi:23S rRNA-/tRNA-specific pseudouridylate synthase
MSFAAAYENDGILIVDKPQGLATTPGAVPSLCEAVFTERPALAAVPGFKDGEGGLLNRLDNDTGGLVLFAKTDEAFQFYTQAMRKTKSEKPTWQWSTAFRTAAMDRSRSPSAIRPSRTSEC